MKALALGLAFFIELGAIAAYSYAGFAGDRPAVYRLVFGIALPLFIIAFWGRYMAPKAASRLQIPWYAAAKLVIYLGAAIALAGSGQPVIAAVFAGLAIFDEILLYLAGETRPKLGD